MSKKYIAKVNRRWVFLCLNEPSEKKPKRRKGAQHCEIKGKYYPILFKDNRRFFFDYREKLYDGEIDLIDKSQNKRARARW